METRIFTFIVHFILAKIVCCQYESSGFQFVQVIPVNLQSTNFAGNKDLSRATNVLQLSNSGLPPKINGLPIVVANNVLQQTNNIPYAKDGLPMAFKGLPSTKNELAMAKNDLLVKNNVLPLIFNEFPIANNDLLMTKDGFILTDHGLPLTKNGLGLIKKCLQEDNNGFRFSIAQNRLELTKSRNYGELKSNNIQLAKEQTSDINSFLKRPIERTEIPFANKEILKSCNKLKLITNDNNIKSMPNTKIPKVSSGINVVNTRTPLTNNGKPKASIEKLLVNNAIHTTVDNDCGCNENKVAAKKGLKFKMPIVSKKLPIKNNQLGNNLQQMCLPMNDKLLNSLPIDNKQTMSRLSVTPSSWASSNSCGFSAMPNNLALSSCGLAATSNNSSSGLAIKLNDFAFSSKDLGSILPKKLASSLSTLGSTCQKDIGSNNSVTSVPVVPLECIDNLPKINGMPVIKVTETVYKLTPVLDSILSVI